MTEHEQYERDKAMHDAFIRGYKACMGDIKIAFERLGSPSLYPMPHDVLSHLAQECSKRELMDAPNPPGYYRANND